MTNHDHHEHAMARKRRMIEEVDAMKGPEMARMYAEMEQNKGKMAKASRMRRDNQEWLATLKAQVQEILAPPDWDRVEISKPGQVWLVVAEFCGYGRSGLGADPLAVARDMAAERRGVQVIEHAPVEASGAAALPEGEGEGIPDAFRSLMIDGESPEKFTVRMQRRWLALQQYRMDSSKGKEDRALPDITEEETKELQDLEARNNVSKWLA